MSSVIAWLLLDAILAVDVKISLKPGAHDAILVGRLKLMKSLRVRCHF